MFLFYSHYTNSSEDVSYRLKVASKQRLMDLSRLICSPDSNPYFVDHIVPCYFFFTTPPVIQEIEKIPQTYCSSTQIISGAVVYITRTSVIIFFLLCSCCENFRKRFRIVEYIKLNMTCIIVNTVCYTDCCRIVICKRDNVLHFMFCPTNKLKIYLKCLTVTK